MRLHDDVDLETVRDQGNLQCITRRGVDKALHDLHVDEVRCTRHHFCGREVDAAHKLGNERAGAGEVGDLVGLQKPDDSQSRVVVQGVDQSERHRCGELAGS